MMLVHHYLRDTAAKFPNKPAIVASDTFYTFSHIDQSSDILARFLQDRGISRGDRIAVLMDNSAEVVIALWAALKAGAVFVPVHHATKADKLAFILEDSGARCLISPAALSHRAADAAREARTVEWVIWAGDSDKTEGESLAAILSAPHQMPKDPGLVDQDLCVIVYTSGSTGKPKGVMMPHRALHNNIWSISTYLKNEPSDVVLCVIPLSFDYGMFQILTGARVGFTVVLERTLAFSYEALQLIGKHGVTGLPGVPTLFASMLQFAPFEGLDLSTLRYLTNTAAAFPPAHIRRLGELLPGAEIFSMFGLTECTRVSFLDPAKLDEKTGSVGKAMPNHETYIVTDEGRRAGPGEVGELVVRGTGVMRGYWRRPEETANALRDGDIPGEKVLYTGDLFTMDADGDLYFVGRRDDVFKCRGEKVSPREVETVLHEIAEVAEAAVVGVPDSVDGHAVKAVLVPKPGQTIDEQAVKRYCRGRLEPWLIPKFIEIRDSLPKTDTGKVSKRIIRSGG